MVVAFFLIVAARPGALTAASCEFDADVALGCRREAMVPRQQRRIEGYGKGDIDGVVSGEIAPQLPYARQKNRVRITPNGKVREIGERCATALAIDVACRRVPAQRMRDLDVDEVRRVQRLSRARKKARLHSLSCG
jgi:hypothetical protein